MRILVFILLSLSFTAFSQDGFALIRKAERKMVHGHYDRALKLLDRAAEMDYGFCGNSRIEAENAIMANRVKIADKQLDTMLAIDLLSDTGTYVAFSDKKLLEHILLFQDKESVRKEFRDALIDVSYTLPDFYFPVHFSFREKPVYFKEIVLSNLFFSLYLSGDYETRIRLIDDFLDSDYTGGLLR